MSAVKESIYELFNNYIKQGKTIISAADEIIEGMNSLKEKGFIDHEEKVVKCVKELLAVSPYERYIALREFFEYTIPKRLIGLFEAEEHIKFKREIVKPFLNPDAKIIELVAEFGDLGANFKLNSELSSLTCIEENMEYYEPMTRLYKICNIDAEIINSDIFSNEKDLFQYDMAIFTTPLANSRFNVDEFGMGHLRERKITKIGIEGAYILKGIDYVKDGGIILVSVPQSFLFGTMHKPIREMILEKTQVLLILDGPKKMYKNGRISTSILVLRKKSSKDYNPKEFLAASFSELTLGTEEFENEKEQFLQEWYSFLQEEEKC